MLTAPTPTQTAEIARLNDLARKRLDHKGNVVLTAGVTALIEEQPTPAGRHPMWTRIKHQGDLLHRLANAEIAKENDPYGERDFGTFELLGKKLYWKIDYYAADGTMQWGSEEPWDADKTVRVVTLMLADEY